MLASLAPALPLQTGRMPVRTAALLLPLALLPAISHHRLCAASLSERQMKNFRKGLEEHFNGNLPRLIAYLKTVDGATALADGSQPAAGGGPGWTPEPVTETVTYTETVCYDSFDSETDCGSPDAAREEETEYEQASTLYSAGQVREIQRRLAERELWRILSESEGRPAPDPDMTLEELDGLVAATEIGDEVALDLDSRTVAERSAPSPADDPAALGGYGEVEGGPEDLDAYLDGLSGWIGERADEYASRNPDAGGAPVSDGQVDDCWLPIYSGSSRGFCLALF